MIHDKASLAIARNQNSNFTTMIQLLQMRANITWEHPPMRVDDTLDNKGFGTFYKGKHTTWHFQFFSEQAGLYGDDTDPTANLVGDFHMVPVISFCKETVTFPFNTFDTENLKTLNTYFSYAGLSNK